MFDLEIFDIMLDTDIIGRNFIYSEEVESTNTMLFDKTNNYNINGTTFLAEKQTNGKGRLNRTWISSKGQNLTFSILLTKVNSLLQKVNFINFAASLSISYALENLYQLKPDLKWPNDVLVNKKKIAGILLESSLKSNKIERLVVGIGLNVNQNLFKGDYAIEPTSVRIENGDLVEREKLLAEILNNFENSLTKIKESQSSILNDWKERCNMIGEKIEIVQGDKSLYGTFDDIDYDGFLILNTKTGYERIHFGDVSLR